MPPKKKKKEGFLIFALEQQRTHLSWIFKPGEFHMF